MKDKFFTSYDQYFPTIIKVKSSLQLPPFKIHHYP